MGAVVGSVSASDADEDTLTYSVTAGNNGGKFPVNGSTGAITVDAGLDYEDTPAYSLTVQADDGNGGTDTATVNISVTDVDESPSSACPPEGIDLADYENADRVMVRVAWLLDNEAMVTSGNPVVIPREAILALYKEDGNTEIHLTSYESVTLSANPSGELEGEDGFAYRSHRIIAFTFAEGCTRSIPGR